VNIGKNVSVSQYAHLCAGSHDYTRADLPLLKPPITIEDDVWIAADVFVGPSVTIGRGAVVGARASVFKNLEGGKVYGGEPARALRDRVGWETGDGEADGDA
jgi:putative colanic acid biosynthesis acetyltransferase WcaF